MKVQLRDAYGNILASSPLGAIVIRVSSLPPVSQVDEGSCTPAAGSTGLYQCRVTPTVSGHRLLSLQVGGVEISKLEQQASARLDLIAYKYDYICIYICISCHFIEVHE